MREALRDELEETTVQVATAPHELVDRHEIETEHRRDDLRRDLLRSERHDANAVFCGLRGLAAELVSLLRFERGDPVVERSVAVVVPMVLDARAARVSGALPRCDVALAKE